MVAPQLLLGVAVGAALVALGWYVFTLARRLEHLERDDDDHRS